MWGDPEYTQPPCTILRPARTFLSILNRRKRVHAFYVKAVFCESIPVPRPWELREPRAEIHRKSRMLEADTPGLMSGDDNVAVLLMKRHRLRS